MTVQPHAVRQEHAVTVYTLPRCVQCEAVKRALTKRGIAHTVVNMATDEQAADWVRAQGVQEAPFTVIAMDNGEHITFTGNRRDIIDAHFPRKES